MHKASWKQAYSLLASALCRLRRHSPVATEWSCGGIQLAPARYRTSNDIRYNDGTVRESPPAIRLLHTANVREMTHPNAVGLVPNCARTVGWSAVWSGPTRTYFRVRCIGPDRWTSNLCSSPRCASVTGLGCSKKKGHRVHRSARGGSRERFWYKRPRRGPPAPSASNLPPHKRELTW